MEFFDDSETVCDRYNSYNFSGKSYAITDQYNGIPQNLITNIIIMTLLMIMYAGFHNCVNQCRLIRIFYRKETSEYEIESDDTENIRVHEEVNFDPDPSRRTVTKQFKTWLPKFLQMNIDQIQRCRGEDAALYIKFQRTLIILVFIIMIASITIILPINKNGGLVSSDVAAFTTFTIGNVPGDSPVLWVHFTISSSVLVVAFILATRYFSGIEIDEEEVSDTLMLKNLPLEACEELAIQDYFKERYPDFKVELVTILHRSDQIIKFNNKKELAESSLRYCLDKLKDKNKVIPVVPSYCGRFSYQVFHCYKCCNQTCCQKLDGVEFYEEEVKHFTEQLAEARLQSLRSDYQLGLAIVRFSSPQEAYQVYKDYQNRSRCWYANCECIRNHDEDESAKIKKLKSYQWKINYARPFAEINWENLHVRGWLWYLRAIVLFLVTFTICFILITPSYTLQMLNVFKISKGIDMLQSPLISQVAPSLILVLVSTMLPILVYYSVKGMGYWFLTKEQITIMIQLYVFLVLSLLILPSFGLTGIPQLFRMLDPKKRNESIMRWECVFMPDGGAFYCNYLISAAFTGISLEFLRLGQLFTHCWGILSSRSKAEEFYIRKKSRWEFEFGLNYAWTLAIFSVIAAYAVIVPIITPCGLFYLVMKHLVDWHNIINVNRYTSVHNSVHTKAALLMQYSLLLMHSTVSAYIVVKRGIKDPLSAVTITILVLGLVFVLFRSIYRTISKFFRKTECFRFLYDEYTKLNFPILPSSENRNPVARGEENSRNYLVIQNRTEDLVSQHSMSQLRRRQSENLPEKRQDPLSPTDQDSSRSSPLHQNLTYGSITPQADSEVQLIG